MQIFLTHGSRKCDSEVKVGEEREEGGGPHMYRIKGTEGREWHACGLGMVMCSQFSGPGPFGHLHMNHDPVLVSPSHSFALARDLTII